MLILLNFAQKSLSFHPLVFGRIFTHALRAVGHINMDICVSGDILSTATSPSLKPVMLNAMKAIPSPRDNKKSIHEYLQQHHDSEDLSDTVKILGSGSDHTAFAFYAGVPSVFYGYKRDGGYPAYHTGFETFYLMDKLVDPGFKSSKVWIADFFKRDQLLP